MAWLERNSVTESLKQSCDADKAGEGKSGKLSDGAKIEVRISTLYEKLKMAFPSFLSSRDILAKWLKDTFKKVIDNWDNLDSESKDNISMILMNITNEICTWVDNIDENNLLEERVSWYVTEMKVIVENHEKKVEDAKWNNLLDWLWELIKKIPKPKWDWDDDKWDDDKWGWKDKEDDDKWSGWGFWWPDIK